MQINQHKRAQASAYEKEKYSKKRENSLETELKTLNVRDKAGFF